MPLTAHNKAQRNEQKTKTKQKIWWANFTDESFHSATANAVGLVQMPASNEYLPSPWQSKVPPLWGELCASRFAFCFFFFFGFYQGGLTIHGSGSAPELVRSFPLLVLPSSFSWAPATSCTKKTATRQRGQNESVLGVKFVSFRCDSWYLFLGNKKYCSSLKTFL